MDEPAADRSKSTGGSLGRRFYETLIALQFAPVESLATFQDNVLRDLVEHVAKQNTFYRERLAPVIDANGKAVLSQWRQIPILTATDVALHYEKLRATGVPKEHGRIFRYQSSGTTSASLAYYRSELADIATACGQFRHFQAMKMDWGKDLALIRAFDPALQRFRRPTPQSEARQESWAPKWIGESERGIIHRLSVFASLDEQVAWLSGLGEVYLNTFPSNAAALARHVKKAGGARPKLLAVLTAGEPMTDDVRHEVETGLGCPCFDIISNAELGIIACQCPAQQGYHLQNELVRVELLDDDGRPVKEGQWGRVVATPLYNFAMPLIRYDTGDWAEFKGSCSCGRHHSLIGSVYGRPSNLLRSGPSDWMRPALARDEMEKYLPDCRWQLVQTAATQAELLYMRYPGNKPVATAEAQRYVTSLLTGGISVAVREVAALGPNAGGKFPAFISRAG